MKPKLAVSFSGGKSSAYLAKRLKHEESHMWDIVNVFMNTGEEAQETLDYVNKCDVKYELNVVWVEAVFDPRKGKGTRHRVVTYETASIKGEPFEEMCRKHGLPNSQFPHCTRELKLYPFKSYLKSIGWKNGAYHTAIGIRADEIDRMSSNANKTKTIYPLIGWGITKQMVLDWESKEPVRLGIPEHIGNCKWCWKKSFRKLGTVAIQHPEYFDFPKMLEAKYKDTGAGFGDRQMFRGKCSVEDIFNLSKQPAFEPFVDGFNWMDERLDVGSSCGESCEIGSDE